MNLKNCSKFSQFFLTVLRFRQVQVRSAPLFHFFNSLFLYHSFFKPGVAGTRRLSVLFYKYTFFTCARSFAKQNSGTLKFPRRGGSGRRKHLIIVCSLFGVFREFFEEKLVANICFAAGARGRLPPPSRPCSIILPGSQNPKPIAQIKEHQSYHRRKPRQ